MARRGKNSGIAMVLAPSLRLGGDAFADFLECSVRLMPTAGIQSSNSELPHSQPLFCRIA